MTAIRYRDYVARVLSDEPRTTSQLAAAISGVLEDEGRACFVDPHCVAANLRKLALAGQAVRTAVTGSKSAAALWSRPSQPPPPGERR